MNDDVNYFTFVFIFVIFDKEAPTKKTKINKKKNNFWLFAINKQKKSNK